MPTAPDVVSSIFRKYEKQELSPEFIRDESNNICDILEITRYGDPGRTARMFAEQGYVAKVNGTCKYDPDKIPLNKKCEFEKYEYVYGYPNFENSKKLMEKRKIDDLFNQLKRLVDENPENQDYLNNILNPIKQPEHHDAHPLNPTQIIYYGVPGCGKSHQIREDLKEKGIPAERTMRVVFHPDYCNADFVGQILPETKDGTVRYNFKAGPFAKILREAYKNPKLEYALIIEEINRGNAAAIFGDLFQLLDRKKKGGRPRNSQWKYLWQGLERLLCQQRLYQRVFPGRLRQCRYRGPCGSKSR